MKRLIKVCKNGTKVYKESCTSDRCGGLGKYAIGIHNGQLRITTVDNGTCYKCGGTGQMEITTREYTPEHEAELKAKAEKKEAEREAKRGAALEAWKKAEAEREAQEKAEALARYESHKYFGNVGDKIEVQATFLYWGSFDTFYGTTYVYTFEDAEGHRFVWKTALGLDIEEDSKVILKGTIKEQSEYHEIRQNVLTRCKVKEVI